MAKNLTEISRNISCFKIFTPIPIYRKDSRTIDREMAIGITYSLRETGIFARIIDT